jgi:hypothetical protein
VADYQGGEHQSGVKLHWLMSAFDPKRTFHTDAFDVAFGGKADVTTALLNIRL